MAYPALFDVLFDTWSPLDCALFFRRDDFVKDLVKKGAHVTEANLRSAVGNDLSFETISLLYHQYKVVQKCNLDPELEDALCEAMKPDTRYKYKFMVWHTAVEKTF